MIIDAVILTLGRIIQHGEPSGYDLTILPEMRIIPKSHVGALVKNPMTEFQMLLTGCVDYGVVRHEDDPIIKRTVCITHVLLFH